MVVERRVGIQVRVDADKFQILEEMRKTGFGLAVTSRNRSDVFNEIIGYGIQTQMLKRELGEREFEKIWKLVHKINWQKINVEKIEKFLQ